ncbi:MAG: TlpA family protein disulfide reductase [Gammaproteobacteria bacterium]|nr:TlpA family protein disulfide reductase [Gammaproteobacteria bacterium]
MRLLKSILTVTVLVFSLSSLAKEVKEPAPDFTLKSMSGENVKLSELRGNVVMINFWASWCGPCRQEMPLLDDFYKKYNKLGFVLLGVNVEEDSSKAAGYLKEVPVSFPILYDNTNKVSKMYDIDAMPSTVLVDREGNMRFLHRGYKPGDENEYKRLMKKLMRE